MKYFALLLTLLLSSSLYAQGDWKIVKSFTSIDEQIFAPQFINEQYGFIIMNSYNGSFPDHGNLGGIYRTTDGGLNWVLTQFPREHYLCVNELSFMTPSHGFAAVREHPDLGHNEGGLYETQDSGMTWNRILPGQSDYSVLAERNVVIYGRSISHDTGRTWSGIEGGRDIVSNKENIIVMLGPPCRLECAPGEFSYYSDDHGLSFTRSERHATGHTGAMIPYTSHVFTAAGDVGTINPVDSSLIGHSSDGGKTWSIVLYDPKSELALAGMDAAGCAVYVQQEEQSPRQDRGLLRSTDFGQTWKSVGGPTTENMHTRISVVGRGAVVFVNDGFGNLWKTTNGGDGTMKSSMLDGVQIKIGDLYLPDTLSITPKQDLVLDLHYEYCDVTWLEKAEVIGLVPTQYTVNGIDTIIREASPLHHFLTIRNIQPEQKQITLKLTFRRDDWLRETKEIKVLIKQSNLATTK